MPTWIRKQPYLSPPRGKRERPRRLSGANWRWKRDLGVREGLVLAERAQPLLLALPYCGVLPVGFMVLAMSAVPIKDSVLSADPGHAMRVLDGTPHILVA